MKYWISTEKWTCYVRVKKGIITETAPMLQRFKGQPLENLKWWAVYRFKGFKIVRLPVYRK